MFKVKETTAYLSEFCHLCFKIIVKLRTRSLLGSEKLQEKYVLTGVEKNNDLNKDVKIKR